MNTPEVFLQFVRLGIGHGMDRINDEIDWIGVHELAEKHGLSAIVLDGADRLVRENRLPQSASMDTTFKKQWIGRVIQGFEHRYELYRKAIAEMASFYNSHGFKMMVIKGYGCSLNWPKPEHRPCGDIDIWLFGKENEAVVS